VLYVAKFADAVDVLHRFQKKTQKTSKADVSLAAQRYRESLKELGLEVVGDLHGLAVDDERSAASVYSQSPSNA
jgi:Phage derived protein Gp49-like (DUF891)